MAWTIIGSDTLSKELKIRKIMIAVLLISVLLLSSFYAVSAEDIVTRGHNSGTAYSSIIGKTIEGNLYSNNGTQYGEATASTKMWDGGCSDVVVSVKLDVLDKVTGQSLIGGQKSGKSPKGGDFISIGGYSFIASSATIYSTHDASTDTVPTSIYLALTWPN